MVEKLQNSLLEIKDKEKVIKQQENILLQFPIIVKSIVYVWWILSILQKLPLTSLINKQVTFTKSS